MNKLPAVALFAAAAAISACSSNAKKAREANPAPCPNIVVLTEASRLIELDGAETVEKVAYSREVIDVTSTCRYFGDKPIEAGVTLDLAFGRGPKGVEDDKTFSYFVAVTRKDAEVIAKEVFPVKVSFSENRPIEAKRVDIDRIFITRAGENISGTNFEIIVGLVVTPEQAIFNRSGKSLKFPNLK
jgi:hypothetical protein